MLKVSNEVRVFIFVEEGDVEASKAIVSAFSFLGIPTYEGTHMKLVGLFNSDISFWICWTSSFFG